MFRDPLCDNRWDKGAFNLNDLKKMSIILLKYKVYLQCILNMSAEEIIAGLRARCVLNNDLIAHCLVMLSEHWLMPNSNGQAIGLVPKRPNLSRDEATFTVQAFDWV